MLGVWLRRGEDLPLESLVDVHLAKVAPPAPAALSRSGQSSIPKGEGRHVHRLGAMAHLPAVFRSAMTLSYLERFSTTEIAHLAGVQPHAIESLLVRGRELMREEFTAYLSSHDDVSEG